MAITISASFPGFPGETTEETIEQSWENEYVITDTYKYIWYKDRWKDVVGIRTYYAYVEVTLPYYRQWDEETQSYTSWIESTANGKTEAVSLYSWWDGENAQTIIVLNSSTLGAFRPRVGGANFQFKGGPAKAYSPAPATGAKNVSRTLNALSWELDV